MKYLCLSILLSLFWLPSQAQDLRINHWKSGVQVLGDECTLRFYVTTTIQNDTGTPVEFLGTADFNVFGNYSNFTGLEHLRAPGFGVNLVTASASIDVSLPTFDDYQLDWYSFHVIWANNAYEENSGAMTYTSCNFFVSNDRCTEIWAKAGDETDRCDTSPIVLDLARDGFDFGGPENPIAFDLLGDNAPRLLQWVGLQQDDAFLALDRNKNGIVDDGTELFGNGTRLLSSGEQAPNGFVALAQFDQTEHGGNDNGFIDPQDDIWSQLLVWLDENADGLCFPEEMFPLAQIGYTALSILPKEKKHQDKFGNWLRFQADSYRQSNQQSHKHRMVDVFFKPLD